MFRIEKYRITFDKHCHDFSVVNNIDGSLIQGSGRYDTCCHIIHGNMVSPTWNGKALLHPNDPVDKIIGKKIALRNAMIRGHRIDPISKKKIPDYHLEFNHKPTRTKIWKAFWTWTESWNKKKEVSPIGKTAIVYDRYRFALPLKGMIEKISKKDGAYQIGFYSNQHGYPNYMAQNHTYFFSQQCQIVGIK